MKIFLTAFLQVAIIGIITILTLKIFYDEINSAYVIAGTCFGAALNHKSESILIKLNFIFGVICGAVSGILLINLIIN